MEPLKEYSRTALNLENVVIPNERLLNTPSAKDGMSRDVEVSLRITGCEYIQSAGILLRLPQSAMATAQILFHRFYYAKSFVKFNCYYTTMASLFMACKIEECCRRLRDVLNVFHHLRQRKKHSHRKEWLKVVAAAVLKCINDVVSRQNVSQSLTNFGTPTRQCSRRKALQQMGEDFNATRRTDSNCGVAVAMVHQLVEVWVPAKYGHCHQCFSPVPMEYVSDEYYRMRNNIIKYERYILKELGFCVHVQHPHKLLITFLQILEQEKNKVLVQKAWNLMNDALRTNIFVRYRVETIACACIFLAARLVKIPLPDNPPWWKMQDVALRDMKAVSLELMALYKRPQRSLEDLEKEVEVLKENLMSQKKVEIKEINIKTTGVTTPPTVKIDSPESSTEVASTAAANDKLLSPSPKVSPLVTNNYRKEEKVRIYRERSPINGHKRKLSSESPPLLEKRTKIQDARRRHSYSPEPMHNSHSKHRRSPSPIRYPRHSPSPIRYPRHSPSPIRYPRHNSPSPGGHHRHSPRRRHSPSPVRQRRSPTPDIPRRYRYSGSPRDHEDKRRHRYSSSPRDIKEKRRKRSESLDDYYEAKRRRHSSSPASDHKRYSLTPEHNSDSKFQPIVGPIKISSNSESDTEDAKLNGIPVQYRVEHRHKRHRHKHRSEKHRKRRERSRSRERSSQTRSHKHGRHHEEREYKREVTLHHSNSISGRSSRERHKLLKSSNSYSYR